MSSSILVIRALDSPEWNADVYGALSSVSRLASAVKNKATVIGLAYSVYKLNRILQSLFKTVDDAMCGRLTDEMAAEVPTPQRLLDSADKLARLSRDIEYFYELFRRVGLTNNSLTASPLSTLASFRGRLVDLSDWFEVIAQSDEVKAIFDRASGERARGEIFDFEQV